MVLFFIWRRVPLKLNFLTTTQFLQAMPINTVPTGFFLLPPLGPAMPVEEIPISVFASSLTFFAIRKAILSETAPCFFISLVLILRIPDFAWLE